MLFTAQSHLLFSGTVSAASQLFFRIICVCVCVDEDYTSVHLQQWVCAVISHPKLVSVASVWLCDPPSVRNSAYFYKNLVS